eukprot:CAMPEP_0115701680 /NCGR_PEP_ID=MMETSP0272-20121206/68104_1 /TAXON_ID=71861 /ORGANISM="Scrippsiella trochoidea, Strain CCMP3099" /LENGTH=192 /DNA_ID=CAMNT_0003142313 /DNA_START=35 /DNA_END=610 /DNA_ORIENTATION=+
MASRGPPGSSSSSQPRPELGGAQAHADDLRLPPADVRGSLVCLECLRILDWATELIKLLANYEACKQYYTWVALSLAVATVLQFQRVVELVLLPVLSVSWRWPAQRGAGEACKSELGLVFGAVRAHATAANVAYQAVFEDVPNFFIDMAIIVNTPDQVDVTWFWVSFFVSVLNFFTICYVMVKEVNLAETAR